MSSSTDESDHEDDDFRDENIHTGETHDATQQNKDNTMLNYSEKETSDSNDSYDHYYHGFNRDEQNLKFDSSKVYQSGDQDSNDEYNSQGNQSEKSHMVTMFCTSSGAKKTPETLDEESSECETKYETESDIEEPHEKLSRHKISHDDLEKSNYHKNMSRKKKYSDSSTTDAEFSPVMKKHRAIKEDTTSDQNNEANKEKVELFIGGKLVGGKTEKINFNKKCKKKYNDSAMINAEGSSTTKKQKVLKEDTTSDQNDKAKQEVMGEEKVESFAVDGKAMLMMKKMGWGEGKGLGKNQQGRVKPVEAFNQRGYRGFGFENKKVEKASSKWDPNEEEIKVIEDMTWLENKKYPLMPTREEMAIWIKIGKKKTIIEDEFDFCDADIVTAILNSKNVFDNLGKMELRQAIGKANPYETTRSAFFLNRAALKMANMDKACGFMFTNPENLSPEELLYFADVCAGPGGFSEYVLWKKKWHAKGFGFTLKNENDFKLTDFYAGTPETFYPYYGPKDDGDVFDPSNQEGFRKLIMQYTQNKGVHFMMADGGFSVAGQENIQEILSKQLYLCQCIVALMIVRTEGHFVTKLFDLFTPFSAGLVYLMYRCFKQICIFKPNSSRPANSERYLICKGKLPNTDSVLQHLLKVNELLLQPKDLADVREMVPTEFLQNEEDFIHYLRMSNELIGRRQINALQKAVAFCNDTKLEERQQSIMKKECLKYWEIPDMQRVSIIPKIVAPEKKVMSLLNKDTAILSAKSTILTVANVNKSLEFPRCWFYLFCTSDAESPNKATLFLSLGRRVTFYYENQKWKRVTEMNLELPPDTLVYAEIVEECINEFKKLRKVYALHILDAYMLGGQDISEDYIETRHKLIRKFCEALQKPLDQKTQTIQIRAKELHLLDSIIEKKLDMPTRRLKKGQFARAYDLPKPLNTEHITNDSNPYYIPNSIVFLKSTTDEWNRHLSKRGTSYLYNRTDRRSVHEFDKPKDAVAPFALTYSRRLVWYWPVCRELPTDTFLNALKENLKI